MVKKHYISFALSVFLIASTPANATGWTAWAKGNFQGSTEYPSSIKTQQGGVLSGGGVRVRWGNLGTIRPINITPPSFSVGCNGMDFSLGAISFMDFDEIVEKLKMVASAAPAFAFKMAIDTVCSQCATIMQDLEEIINMINNMSLDACKMAENIGNGIGHALGSSISSPGGSGFSDSYSAISDGIRTVGGYTSMVTGAINNLDDITIKSRFYGSFLEYVKEHSQNQTVKDFIPYLAAIAGDFAVILKPNEEKTSIVPLNGNIEEVSKIYLSFLEPSGFNSRKKETAVLTMNGSDKIPAGIVWRTTFESDTPATGLDNTLYTSLKDIILKMGFTGSKLSNAERSFLTMLPKNGYKILNAIYATGDGTGTLSSEQEGYLKDYAKYVTLNYLTETLKNSISAVQETVSDYSKSLTITDEGKQGLDEMQKFVKRLGAVSNKINDEHNYWLAKMPKIDQNLYQKQLEAQIKNSLK